MKKQAAVSVARASATACSSPASTPPDASITKIAPSVAAKPSIDLGEEVRVAGRVDKRDAGAVVLERPDREAQRLVALLLLGLEVEMGGPVIDLAQPRDRPGLEHELLGERRLAGARVAGQDDAPKVGEVDALHRHGFVGPQSCRRRRVGRAGGPGGGWMRDRRGTVAVLVIA